jgi:hypothetical protein
MFDDLDAATAHGALLQRPYIIMESLRVGNGTYSWRVLPYGAHWLWRAGTFLYMMRWPLVGLLALRFTRQSHHPRKD